MQELVIDPTWFLYNEAEPEFRYRAPVPGSVHDALLAANALPNVHFGFNEVEQKWVGDATWIYETSIEVPRHLLNEDYIELICEGLDTFCEVSINDQPVGQTDNMFRSWRWDIKDKLEAGMNLLKLRFLPVDSAITKHHQKRHLPAWNEPPHSWWGKTGRGYVRKQACQFGWDWGPQCPSAGPWRDVRIVAGTGARLRDWQHLQTHHSDGSVDLAITVLPDSGADLRIRGNLVLDGQIIAQIEEDFWGGWEWCVHLDQPELWWPNGMGAQPLYDLQLILMNPQGKVLDHLHQRIGLRHLELVQQPDAWGRSFTFNVNGRSFFAKGANWIPLDAHPSARNLDTRYRQLLDQAAQAHMNMLRVWGGGYFSHDAFYAICDELGILVWQDLMFGCGTYPTWDNSFLDSVWHETVDNVRRLRHHACLACWCGNNELEMGFCAPQWQTAKDGPGGHAGKMAWASYLDLFERVLPSAVQFADTTRPYIPGSPHSRDGQRRNPDSPCSGDWHSWTVWFTPAPFEQYRDLNHRFLSEFGFQSLPSAATLARYAPSDETVALDSPWLQFRQRSQPGNTRIREIVTDWFGTAANDDFARFCLLSQITQGLGLKTGIEHWRSLFPRCGGATYWQLNDRWAAPTWATLDCDGAWKASHYFAKRFFAPLLIIGKENAASGSVEVWMANDHPFTVTGTAKLTLYHTSGSILWQHQSRVTAEGNSFVTAIGNFDLATVLGANWNPTQSVLWLEFNPDEELLDQHAQLEPSDNMVLFCRPRELATGAPRLSWHLHPGPFDGIAEVHLHNGDTPAFWLQLHHPTAILQASDQFFSLPPDTNVALRVLYPGTLSFDVLKSQLQILSPLPLTQVAH